MQKLGQHRRRGISLTTATLSAASLLIAAPAHAVDINQVRSQIIALQQQATNIAENAQQAQVDFNNLNNQLSSLANRTNADQKSLKGLQSGLGAIAAEQYKTGGLGQGLALLFSSDPSLYLANAGSLAIVTQKKAIQMRQFAQAKQRLQASSLLVSDKLALVKAAKARYVAAQEQANKKLAEAQALYNKLNAAEKKRLAQLAASQDKAQNSFSLSAVNGLKFGSSRGAIALKFAIKQIGAWYVFGGAGPRYWDCSGLTMRAFQQAGISLPHSAAYQFSFGRAVPRNMLQPGDLVFFGRPITHVGIYLGHNLMVDAPHSGARVRVESFSSWFGSEVYDGARRI
jgi:cell wall-associated NlpC family hydrolase